MRLTLRTMLCYLDDVLEPLNVSEVPATVLLTLFALAGWFVSVLASVFLLDDASGTALVLGAIAIGIAAAVAAIAGESHPQQREAPDQRVARGERRAIVGTNGVGQAKVFEGSFEDGEGEV